MLLSCKPKREVVYLHWSKVHCQALPDGLYIGVAVGKRQADPWTVLLGKEGTLIVGVKVAWGSPVDTS